MARSAGPPPARGAAAAARGPSPACAARSAAQRAKISFILRAAARAERGGTGAGLGQSPSLPAHDGTWSLGARGGARGRPLSGLQVPGGVGRTALPLAVGDTGGIQARPRASFSPPWSAPVTALALQPAGIAGPWLLGLPRVCG